MNANVSPQGYAVIDTRGVRAAVWRHALCGVAAAAWLCSGCAVEQIDEGWYTLPTQEEVLLEPWMVGLAYEPIEFASSTGDAMYGWFIPADDAPATVLFNHGAVMNRSLHPQYYLVLHHLGYNVVVYDYQGFGDSAGLANLGSLIPDADAALEYVQGMSAPGTEHIVLFGFSLGTLPTLAQAARSPDRVVAVIIEGSFYSESLSPLAYPLLGMLPLPEVIEKFTAAYPALDPRNHIADITIPKLFIQSPQDPITLFSGAEHLYELAPEPKQLVEVFGGHGLPPIVDLRYYDALLAFLDRVAPGESANVD